MRVIYKDDPITNKRHAVAYKLLKNRGIEKIAYNINTANPVVNPVEDNSDKPLITQKVLIGNGEIITIGINYLIYIESIIMDIDIPFSDDAELLIYTPRDVVYRFSIGGKTGRNTFGFTEDDILIHEPYDALKTGIPVMDIDEKIFPMIISNGPECNTVSFRVINNSNSNALAKIIISTKPVPEPEPETESGETT